MHRPAQTQFMAKYMAKLPPFGDIHSPAAESTGGSENDLQPCRLGADATAMIKKMFGLAAFAALIAAGGAWAGAAPTPGTLRFSAPCPEPRLQIPGADLYYPHTATFTVQADRPGFYTLWCGADIITIEHVEAEGTPR